MENKRKEEKKRKEKDFGMVQVMWYNVHNVRMTNLVQKNPSKE